MTVTFCIVDDIVFGRNKGDLFGDNTFRLGLNWSLMKGRSVYVSPQLYFTDNFNTVFPGIRIGFGL